MALSKPTAGSSSKLGKYELLRELTGSGVASTWLARVAEDASGQLYSILRLHRHITKNVEVAEAFLHAGLAAQRLRHAAVVPLLETGVSDGEVFAVSEYVEGDTLANLVRAAGTEGLSQPIVLRIAFDILEALAAAYELPEPLIHGEMNPWSVLIGPDGRSRVVGFGVARALSRIGLHGIKNHDRLAYASPERVKIMASSAAASLDMATPAADLFSVGVMLWEGVTKQRLFASRMEAAIIQKVLTATIERPNQAGAHLDTEIEDAIMSALDRDQDKRVSSPSALRAALEAAGAEPASHQQVAAELEAKCGKTLASRRREVELAVSQPRVAAGRGPAAPRPRAATLLGMAVHADGPGVASAETPRPPKVAADEESTAIMPQPAIVAPPPIGTGSPNPAPPQPEDRRDPAAPAAKPRPLPKPRSSTLLGLALPKSDAAAGAAAPQPGSTVVDETTQELDIDVDAEEVPTSQISAVVGEATAKAPAKPAPPPLRARAAKPSTPDDDTIDDSGAATQASIAAEATTRHATTATTAKEPPRSMTPVAGTPAAPSSADQTGEQWVAEVNNAPVRARGPAAVAVDQLGTGSTLGRYEILMEVARGGMASVWLGRAKGSRGFTKLVAIKTMLPDVSDDPEFERMFLDEARVAAKIRHPNVAEIQDLGEEDNVLYLVMEWVDGDTLAGLQRAAKSLGGLPVPIILRIASQTCAGLHAAHELRDETGESLDLIHRDISPANVLVSSQGFVKIVDFGIAKSKGRLHVTRAGATVKGKTPYLSPEQLGGIQIDRRSDVFSLGALLYVLTTGLHPFRGDNDLKTIENIALKNPVPLRRVVPSVPEEFEKIVQRALEKQPDKRYSSAAELGKAIDDLAAKLDPISDEDVAAFVQRAVGETLRQRTNEIKAAIEKLDKAATEGGFTGQTMTLTIPQIEDPPAVPDLRAPDVDAKVVVRDADGTLIVDGKPAGAEPDVGDESSDVPVEVPTESAIEPLLSGPITSRPPDPRRRRVLQMTVAGVVIGFAILGLLAVVTNESTDAASRPVPSAPTKTTAEASKPPPPAPPPALPPVPTVAETAEPAVEDASAGEEVKDEPEETSTDSSAAAPPPPPPKKPVLPPPGGWPKAPPPPPKKYNPMGI
jgi:eukaryotic-like serine/threonine-protein kinase